MYSFKIEDFREIVQFWYCLSGLQKENVLCIIFLNQLLMANHLYRLHLHSVILTVWSPCFEEWNSQMSSMFWEDRP